MNIEDCKLWQDICKEAEARKEAWIQELRAQGFKAAHPNDGWVDRVNNEVFFAYPHFRDELNLYDKVMLGWDFEKKTQRPVRIVSKRVSLSGQTWWKFKDIKE